MHTLTSSATCPATVLTVIGTRSAPPGSKVAEAQPAEAGGRAKVTSGSTWTAGALGPLQLAASKLIPRPAPSTTGTPASRPQPTRMAYLERAIRTAAMTIRAPSTSTARGRAARHQPVVVRTVKRSAERWWATIIR